MTLALEAAELRKRFGAVEALRGASLQVREGTVHALLGENGAGKTTLMRAAYGMLRPDSGVLRVFGEPARFRSTADAIARGVGMVHQHFTLVPAMTVAENVALGMHGRYDASQAAERVRAIGERTGLILDPRTRVADLPVGAQQRLEIVKALAHEARLLILDEPTAVLAPDEAEDLMRWVRHFRESGRSVVLITHKLRESLAIADDVTVLRRGATVLSGPARELDEPTLVAALIGEEESGIRGARDAQVAGGRDAKPSNTSGAIVAALREARVAAPGGGDALQATTIDIRGGEIVGVAAIEGSGQRELLRILAGRVAPSAGTVSLPATIAFIPEDRHQDAMVLDMTLVENAALSNLGSRTGRMPWPELRQQSARLLERFDVRAAGIDARGRDLSGGNQQKFVLGRELEGSPALVIAENPTRGLDIRATEAVQRQLRIAKESGAAVVLYSSDLDEVLSIADRVLVVHDGHVREVSPPNRESVGRAMLGAS